MLMPSAMAPSMAGRPATVAGILTNTFGRSRRDHSSRARASVASLSSESSGSTSMLAKPSVPFDSSYTERRTSAASPTSVDRDLLVDLADVVACRDLAADELVVLPGGDRLGEDGRVARQAADAVGHHLLELAGLEQVAVDEVDPRALVLLGMQPLQRVSCRSSRPPLRSWSRAARSRLSRLALFRRPSRLLLPTGSDRPARAPRPRCVPRRSRPPPAARPACRIRA